MEFSFGERAILIHYPTCEGSENRKTQLLRALINKYFFFFFFFANVQ